MFFWCFPVPLSRVRGVVQVPNKPITMTGMSTLPEPEWTRISISNFWIRTHRILNKIDNFLISFLVIGHKTWYWNGTHSSYFRTGIASSNVYLSITDHVLAANPCCFDQLKKTFFVTFITKKFLKIRWYCNFSFFLSEIYLILLALFVERILRRHTGKCHMQHKHGCNVPECPAEVWC